MAEVDQEKLFLRNMEVRRLLQNQIVQLKADLAKWGGHIHNCAKGAAFSYSPTAKCDCGWLEAQERWE